MEDLVLVETKTHINLVNENLDDNRHKFVNINNNSLKLKDLSKLKCKNNIVLHYMINNQRGINKAAKELLTHIEDFKLIPNLTLVLMIPTSGLNNLTIPELRKEAQLKYDNSLESMELLRRAFNENSMKFISYTFDAGLALPKEIISKSEYVVELEDKMNSTHYMFSQLLIYKNKSIN